MRRSRDAPDVLASLGTNTPPRENARELAIDILTSLWPVAAAGLVAAFASLAGVYLVLAKPEFTRRASRRFVAFAGGSVLGAAVLHLLPEAASLAPRWAGVTAIVAFLVLYLAETHTLPHVHGPHSGDAPGPHVHLGYLAALGFTAHAVFDGLALGAGYRQGAPLAVSTLLAVFAHKVPEGMALASLLLLGDFSPRRALGLSWAVAMLTPAVAALSFGLLGAWFTPDRMGLVLAVVAGSFLYISACDLLPEIRRNPRASDSGLILLGVIVIALLAH